MASAFPINHGLLPPEAAPHHQYFASAVQVADYLVRHIGIAGSFEQVDPIADGAWTQLSGWRILYGADRPDTKMGRASVAKTLRSLPEILKGLI